MAERRLSLVLVILRLDTCLRIPYTAEGFW